MYKNWQDDASFSDFIISHLLSCSSIKIQKQVLYELVQKRRKLSKQLFNNNLHRLKKKGVLGFNSDKDIIIHKSALKSHVLFKKIKTKPAGDTRVIVLFDIPEKKRKVRNWLRLQLKLWNFEMLQQSVWLGKGPLPPEFSERLRLFGITKGVKILRFKSVKI